MSRVTIVGLGGSLAPHSASLSALRVALDGARDYGAEVRLFDLRELNLPMFVPGAEPVPAAARELCDAVHAAQGMLWSSPLYHGTVSGAFKNALDWFQLLSDRNPPYLTDKVVGLISTAGGTHGLQDVNTMEFAVRALRGWVGAAGAPDSTSVAGVQGGSRPRQADRRPTAGAGSRTRSCGAAIRGWHDHDARGEHGGGTGRTVAVGGGVKGATQRADANRAAARSRRVRRLKSEIEHDISVDGADLAAPAIKATCRRVSE